MSSPASWHNPILKRLVLCILDGWGEAAHSADAKKNGNAIALAKTPTWQKLCRSRLQSVITTSGSAVGLPDGQMGNSEVGHLHIGAGRIVEQSLQRINSAIAPQKSSNEFTEDFFKNNALVNIANSMLQNKLQHRKHDDKQGAEARKPIMHIMGILSNGGVHGHEDHLFALLQLFARAGVETRVHAFLDGRDSSTCYSREGLPRFLARIRNAGLKEPVFATIIGRYYAMDRDKNWLRTERAWRAIAIADAEKKSSPENALQKLYSAQGYSDEFVSPILFPQHDGIRKGDGILFGNFRSERMKQLAMALALPEFNNFNRKAYRPPQAIGSLVDYGSVFANAIQVAFPSPALEQTLGECIAQAGLNQLRIAETEKYAHVTYFINGGHEAPFKGEQRLLIPSPKVATYDLRPAMAAQEVTHALIKALREGEHSVIIVNYANADMVGHTGKLNAAIEAIEVLDNCLAQILSINNLGGALKNTAFMFFADHGNAECMRDPYTGAPHTSHTCNPIRLILTSTTSSVLAPITCLADRGSLSDIAPSALELLGLPIPALMSGQSLLRGVKYNA